MGRFRKITKKISKKGKGRHNILDNLPHNKIPRLAARGVFYYKEGGP